MINRHRRSPIWLALSGLCLLPLIGNAQESSPGGKKPRVIEEIIVSAQKRDEAVQDVPISMSVMTAEFMVEQGVTDLREALLYVPNVAVEQAG
ncbi:TonB-dependent receptor plug domain-containing protein, partial [Litorivivens sp.]